MLQNVPLIMIGLSWSIGSRGFAQVVEPDSLKLAHPLPDAPVSLNGFFNFTVPLSFLDNPLSQSQVLYKASLEEWISLDPFSGNFQGHVPSSELLPQMIDFSATNGARETDGIVQWLNLSVALTGAPDSSIQSTDLANEESIKSYCGTGIFRLNSTELLPHIEQFLNFESSYLSSFLVGQLKQVNYTRATDPHHSANLFRFTLPGSIFETEHDCNVLGITLGVVGGGSLPNWIVQSETELWHFRDTDFTIGGYPNDIEESYNLRIDVYLPFNKSHSYIFLLAVDVTDGRHLISVSYETLNHVIYLDSSTDTWQLEIPQKLFRNSYAEDRFPLRFQSFTPNSTLTFLSSTMVLKGVLSDVSNVSERFLIIARDNHFVTFYEGLVVIRRTMAEEGLYLTGADPSVFALSHDSTLITISTFLGFIFISFMIGFLLYRRESKKAYHEKLNLVIEKQKSLPQEEPNYLTGYLIYLARGACIYGLLMRPYKQKCADIDRLYRSKLKPSTLAEPHVETRIDVIQMDPYVSPSVMITPKAVSCHDGHASSTWEGSRVMNRSEDDDTSHLRRFKAIIGRAFHYSYPIDSIVQALGLDQEQETECPIRFSAKLHPSGDPLPQWLNFNPKRCSFFGIPHKIERKEWIIEIVAYLTDLDSTSPRIVARSVSEVFVLNVGNQ